ncbi:MAG: transposase [Planctomycetota bacterium]
MMSTPLRLSYANALHHVTLRCNNREFLFADPSFALFLELLQKARGRFRLSLYNYCLMTNHVHLLLETPAADTLSKAMHWIANTFSRQFNKAAGRRGHLWEGRFRSTIVEAESYFFRCMAYLDLNPVRAGMAATPLDYRWSGHRAIRDESAAELDLHALYLESGADSASRYDSYVQLVREEAARPPVSLAREYFVGTRRFVNRMTTRFGLREGRYLRRRKLSSQLECLGPSHGRASDAVVE